MRKYKRKRAPQWRDKDRRMTLAAQMRAAGMSLREVAKELAVDERTVRRDLSRWEQERPNVVPLVRQNSAASRPAGGNLPQQNAAPDSTVIELRRHA